MFYLITIIKNSSKTCDFVNIINKFSSIEKFLLLLYLVSFSIIFSLLILLTFYLYNYILPSSLQTISLPCLFYFSLCFSLFLPRRYPFNSTSFFSHKRLSLSYMSFYFYFIPLRFPIFLLFFYTIKFWSTFFHVTLLSHTTTWERRHRHRNR